MLVAPAPVFACSCVVPPPPSEALEAAAAVFTGEVTNLSRRGRGDRYVVTFRVADVYKGEVRHRATLTTAQSTAACGYPFEEGERYIVYAHRMDDGTLAAGLCSRTARLDDAAEDLQVLEPIGSGSDVVGTTGGLCGGPSNAAALQAALFVLLAVGLAGRRRR